MAVEHRKEDRASRNCVKCGEASRTGSHAAARVRVRFSAIDTRINERPVTTIVGHGGFHGYHRDIVRLRDLTKIAIHDGQVPDECVYRHERLVNNNILWPPPMRVRPNPACNEISIAEIVTGEGLIQCVRHGGKIASRQQID